MTDSIKAQVSRGYIVKLSVGFQISIDEEELSILMNAINRGGMVRLKQGIIRADLVAGIIEDRERIVNVERFNADTGERESEMKLLADVFKGVEFKQLKGQENKLLE